MRNLFLLVFILGIGALGAFGFLSLKQNMDKQEIKEELTKIAGGLSLDLSNADKFRDEVYQTVNKRDNTKLEDKKKDIEIHCRALSREEEKKLLKESPLIDLNPSSLKNATYIIEKTIAVNYVSSWLIVTSKPISLEAKSYDEVEVTTWEKSQERMKKREAQAEARAKAETRRNKKRKNDSDEVTEDTERKKKKKKRKKRRRKKKKRKDDDD